MKVISIIQRVRNLLQDNGAVPRWSNDDLLDAYNEALLAVVQNRPDVNSTLVTFNCQAQALQSLPPVTYRLLDMGDIALYASPDGLVRIAGGRADLMTRNIINPEDWRERFKPSTIHGCFHDGGILASMATPSTAAALSSALTAAPLPSWKVPTP